MKLQRALTTKQLYMIALGGCIGNSLFLAMGSSIHLAGAMGTAISYSLIGLMVFCIMSCLAEMSAYRPVAGSFCEHATRYVSPSFGFAMSINYWFNWTVTLAGELSAAIIVIHYWFPHLNNNIIASTITLLILSINLCSVKNFGQAEYWLSMIKVAAIIIFIIIGTLMATGLIGKHTNYLTTPQHYPNLFSRHGWLSLFSVMLIAGFSFQGSELIGIAAGESRHPQRDIPKASRLILWRILLFYVLTAIVIGALIAPNNTHLLSADTQHIAYSPFTMIMAMAHIPASATIMNIIILTAILSTANSAIYASSRTLYQVGHSFQGPFACLTRLNQQGVPIMALLISLFAGSLVYLLAYLGCHTMLLWLISASALSGFIAWIGIAVSHMYFRRHLQQQRIHTDELPYASRFYPITSITALVMCLIITLGQNYSQWFTEYIHWSKVCLTYSSVAIFILCWLTHAICSQFNLMPSKTT